MTDNHLIGQQIQGYTMIQKLGRGGYGTVYLGVKEDLGKQYKTAMKHISMPDAEGYEAVLQDYGYKKAAAHAHLEKMAETVAAEINTLLELSKKDNRHIVAYYDHEIRKTEEPFHFDIFMRMEYLTPLNSHMRQAGMTVREAVKMGLHMCDALSLCHSSGVIHRDIKEANIFISEDGCYKLGDFGVAKAQMEATQAGSVKGTASYMAPEIYLREPYDSSVDIYSLGIVLYKLLNNQRLPFMPDAPALFTADDVNDAEARRLRGDRPGLPANAKNRLGEMIVKACSVKKERYQNAADFQKDLQEFLDAADKTYLETEILKAAGMDESLDSHFEKTGHSGTQSQGVTAAMGVPGACGTAGIPLSQNPYAQTPGKKKKHLLAACIILAAVSAAGIAGYLAVSRMTNPVRLFEEAVLENDFQKAAQLYETKISSGKQEELAEAAGFAADHVQGALEKYRQGEMEYEDALNQIQEMKKIGIVSGEETEPLIERLNEMRVSRTAYENAGKEVKSGDYESAISSFHKVIQDDPNYDKAQKELAAAARSYKEELLASLAGLDSKEGYQSAISVLEKGLLVVPDDADLLAAIQDYEKKIDDEITLAIDTVIQDAKAAVSESDDYASAFTKLRTASRQFPDREELKTAMSEVEDAYTARELAEAEKLANESKYQEAAQRLSDALTLSPDNERIKTAISEYKEKYPVLLQKLVYFTGEELSNDGQEMDNIQGMQENIVDSHYNSFDNVYKLNGKYKKITGILYQPFEDRSNRDEKNLEIYGDGRLLVTAAVSAGIEPVSFQADLTQVQELEIILSYGGRGRLANVQLYQ